MYALSLYFRLIGARISAQMEYKTSFLLDTVSHFLVTFLDFTSIAILFNRFKGLRGWSLWEVAFLYGMVAICFALSEMIGRDFHVFSRLILQGEFDRCLIRPLGTFFQILSSEFQLRRLGRLSQGLLILLIACLNLKLSWDPGKMLFLALAVAGGMLFFIGLHVIGATICFWTVQSIEIINVFTYGGVESANYPISIYREWFRDLFIFVIPLSFVNYFPSLYLLDKPDPLGLPLILRYIGPFVGVLFFSVSVLFWNFGVKHYQSTGS